MGPIKLAIFFILGIFLRRFFRRYLALKKMENLSRKRKKDDPDTIEAEFDRL